MTIDVNNELFESASENLQDGMDRIGDGLREGLDGIGDGIAWAGFWIALGLVLAVGVWKGVVIL